MVGSFEYNLPTKHVIVFNSIDPVKRPEASGPADSVTRIQFRFPGKYHEIIIVVVFH